MTDPLLRQTDDGGDITVENGLVLMSDGLPSAAYLSLYGGNEDDAGDSATAALQWWGNLDEPDAAGRYRSETQALVKNLPTTGGNLRRYEQAAARDLAWLVETGVARSVTVSCTIPALNRVRHEITIVTLTRTVQLVFG
jgi:phage gp46-like protein